MKWTAAGVLWGALAGILLAMWVGGMTAGFFWTFVFGDDPWPAWTGPAIITVAAACGLAASFAGAFVGRRIGRAREAASDESRAGRGTHRVATLVLVAGLLAWGGLAATAWTRDQESERRRAAARAADAFVARQHRIDRIGASLNRDEERLDIRLHGSGERAGWYRLVLAIFEDHAGAEPLWLRLDTVSLSPGPFTRTWRVPLEPVSRAYFARVLDDARMRVLADVRLEVRASLLALPEPDERAGHVERAPDYVRAAPDGAAIRAERKAVLPVTLEHVP